MDEFLRNFIYKKWRIGGFSFSFLDALLAVCITGTGLFLRAAVIAYTPTDAAKICGIFLEYMLALLCAALVRGYTGSRNRAFYTYAILVIYPTIVANGALWNRNSVYYVLLFFVGLYFCSRKSWALGGVSLLAGLLIAGGRLWQALQSGAADNWQTVLTTAEEETEYVRGLNLGWPNVYEIIGKTAFVNLLDKVSLLFLAGFLAALIYCFAVKRVRLTADLTLRLFLFLALLLPYVAPYMPAWAGYTADVAALLYCMRWPKRFFLPMSQLIVSYSAYACAINGETKLPMVVFAVLLLVELVIVGADVYREAAGQAG